MKTVTLHARDCDVPNKRGACTCGGKVVEMPKTLLPKSPGARMEYLMDLYAPMDEEGVRHPEHGVISQAELTRLMNMPTE